MYFPFLCLFATYFTSKTWYMILKEVLSIHRYAVITFLSILYKEVFNSHRNLHLKSEIVKYYRQLRLLNPELRRRMTLVYLLWGTITQSKLKKSIFGGTFRREKRVSNRIRHSSVDQVQIVSYICNQNWFGMFIKHLHLYTNSH